MTFDELHTFISLAQTKSFSRTAELLFTSQSTVSFRIRSIESQVGRQLISRTTKKIELTPAGQDFLNYALRIETLYQEGMQAVSLNNFRYKVAIGSPDSFWSNILFPALEQFFVSHKEISFNLVSDHSWILNQMIIEGKLDVGISFIPVRHPNVEYVPLAKNPFVLVAHKEMALPDERLTPQNFNQFPLIYCHWSDSFNEWFNSNYCLQSHFFEVERASLFIQMLRKQLGVGFLPMRIAKHYLNKGEMVLLDFDSSDTVPWEENYIMYNRRQGKRVLPIVDEIQKYVNEAELNYSKD